MHTLLEFQGETWRRDNRASCLILFVSSSPHPFCGDRLISADLELAFVPAWLTSEDLENARPHRMLHIDVDFYLPRTGDWRTLAGQRFGGEAPEEDDEPVESWKLAGAESAREIADVINAQKDGRIPGPEIEVWSHGNGEGSIQTHLNEESLRDRVLTFGAWSETDPYELPFTIEGLIVTEAAKKARMALLGARIRELFGIVTPDLPELERRSKEGRPFRYSSVARFDKIFCHVPINTAEPLTYAREFVKRELRQTEFYQCRVNGTDRHGKINPEHAVSEAGLLVTMTTPIGPRAGLWLPGDPGTP